MKKNKIQVHPKENLPPEQPVEKTSIGSWFDWKNNWIQLLIIFASAILIYSNTFTHDYALDDQMVIYDNKFVKGGIDSVGRILTSDAFEGFFGERGSQLISGGRYRPLSFVSFAIEWQLFGRNPMIGHIINVLTYGLLCCLIYIFLAWLFPQNNLSDTKWSRYLTLPFVATLLYTLHPIHTEVVANIKGRDELYGFFFAVLALIYFFQIFKHRWYDYVWVFVLFFLALLSKENAITFVLIFPLIVIIKNIKIGDGKFIFPYLMIIVAVGLYMFLRMTSTKVGITAHTEEILNNPFVRAEGTEKIGTILYSFFAYFKLLLFPHPLTHDYYFNQIPYRKLSEPLVLLVVVAIVALVYWLIKQWRTRSEIVFGVLFFGITFSIVSNIAFTVGIIMNERFVFISSLGFCIILSAILLRWVKNKQVLVGVLVLISTLYIGKTFSRNFAWKNNYTLFSTDYYTSNNSAKVATAYGGVMLDKATEIFFKDSLGAKKMIDSGLKILEHSLRIYPENSQAWLLYGNGMFAKTKDKAKAIEIYKTATRLRPNYFDGLYNIGILNYNDNQLDTAQLYFEQAIAANPAHKEVRDILSKLYARQGRTQDAINISGKQSSEGLGDLALNAKEGGNYQEAINLAQQALNTNANDAKANFVMGICLSRHLNRLTEGIPYLEKAIRLEPNNGYWMEDLAVAYGMSGRIRETIPLLEKVIALRPNEPAGYRNLATTYYNLGDKKKAEYYMNLASQKTTK